MNKKVILVIAIVVLSLVTALGCTSQGTTSGNNGGVTLPSGTVLTTGGNNSQSTGIWVTGEGKVTATPDLMLITLGIESQETTVAVAQSKAVQAMDAVKKILIEQGIAEKDIQTQYFNISRVTRWLQTENKEEVIGYRVTNTVTVKVRQLNKAGTIIDAVTAAAGDLTRINGVSFTVEDPTPFENQAREKAIKDAMAKATQIATLAGITLDKPTYISVGSNSPGPIRVFDAYNEKAVGAAVPTTSISPGELEIQATVTIVYGIK